jgi:hypothetical protein
MLIVVILEFLYANEMLPVPAVIEVTLNPPDAAGVFIVSPPPGLEMVRVSGYFRITMPLLPLPPEP